MVNVLVVDDDIINTKTFVKRLGKKGFNVHAVHTGLECLDFLNKHSDYVVLLDIVMPDLDGITVLQKIREKWSKTEVPVIMLSANDEVDQIVNCLNLMANDYITKPANMEIASARINAQSSLQQLSQVAMKKNEIETINSMVITFNHEINNPLTIAIGTLQKDFSKLTEEKIKVALNAMFRIATIVKKIDRVTANGEIEKEEYASDRKMIKLK